MIFPGYAAQMIARLRAAGYSAYAVGGCVRDSLLGRTPNDWDIATSAYPQETEKVFTDPCYRVRTGSGVRHGTVTVSLADEPTAACEITTYRSDGTYSDHRRPDAVAFVSDIREDLARRDFTVNAMAASPSEEGEEPTILDPCGGEADLAAGLLRCVGEPARRFDEDALRILRGLRFAARYGFRIEERTAAAMHAQAHLLAYIAPERIGTELTGILSGKHCGAVAEQFGDIFAFLLPGCDCAGAEQRLAAVPSWHLRLAVLCRECGAAGLRKTLLRFALGTAMTERILRLLAYRDAPLAGHRELCRIADAFGEAGAEEYFAFRRALAPEDAALSTAEAGTLALFRPGVCYNTATLAADGRVLLAAGIPAGPDVGRILHRLTEEVIAGRLQNDRKALIEYAKRVHERKDNG